MNDSLEREDGSEKARSDSKSPDNQKWYQEPEYIEIANFPKEKGWHPKLTQEQIVYAYEKDISEPKGQEYAQFLAELGLKPVKDIEIPVPIPRPVPPKPKPKPKPKPVEDDYEKRKRRRGRGIEGGHETDDTKGPEEVDGPIDVIPRLGEDDDTKGPKGPTGVIPRPVEDDDTKGPKEQNEEEEFVKVVKVEKNFKNRITPWLCAAAAALILATGLSIDKPLNIIETTSTTIVVDNDLKYSLTEYIREHGYQDETIENIIYKFAADYDISIGDKFDLSGKATAYEFGNLTGNTATLDGKQVVTGFCLYSPSTEDVKYEYSFYEDRALDGTPDRTNVAGITNKIDVSLNEFLSKLNTSEYNIEDIRFSLHFGTTGWVDFSDLIKINDEKIEAKITKLVEICKEGATYEGVLEDHESDFISIKSASGADVEIPITDEHDNLLPDGTHVIGTDGREYIISNLEIVRDEKVDTTTNIEYLEGAPRLKWDIIDCELVAGIAPLVAAAGFAIASKLKNKKLESEPNFFEFENKPDYENFKRDFERAKKERISHSKFGQTMRRIFYGEEVHISKDLSDDQIEEIYSTIVNTHNEDYSYNPSDQIRYKDGQIVAISSDDKITNITSLVAHVGMENKPSGEGLVTPEIVEQYGGGPKK